MICGAIIPLDLIKSITGATSDAVASMQGRAIVQLIEGYLGITLIKQDFQNERITVPYKHSRVFKTKHYPINSVSELNFITAEATYQASQKQLMLGYHIVEVIGTLPVGVSAVKITYNAGLYDSWADVPAIIQLAAEELLKYRFDPKFSAGYSSEHFGDYSYSKGNFTRGLPAEIAGMLDGVEL